MKRSIHCTCKHHMWAFSFLLHRTVNLIEKYQTNECRMHCTNKIRIYIDKYRLKKWNWESTVLLLLQMTESRQRIERAKRLPKKKKSKLWNEYKFEIEDYYGFCERLFSLSLFCLFKPFTDGDNDDTRKDQTTKFRLTHVLHSFGIKYWNIERNPIKNVYLWCV